MLRSLTIKSIVLIHTIWMLAVVASLPVAIIYPQSHKVVLVFIGITLLAQIPLGACPLTYLENRLRGSQSYQGTWMGHYLQRLFGISVSDKSLRLIHTTYFVCVILIAIFYRMNLAF